MKKLWKWYYYFKKPMTKCDMIIAYGRISGVKVVDMKARCIASENFIGMPSVKN